MTQKIIDIGAAPNDGTGDPLRTAFDDTNANFTELYNPPPLTVPGGGTGITVYNPGDLIYAATGTTLGRLGDVAVGRVLLSGGVEQPPGYGKVDLSTMTTGAVPPGGGGVPPGGTTGAVLAKVSGADYNTAWVPPTSGGTVTSVNVSGGTTGLTATGGPVTTAGTITLGGTLGVDHGGTGTSTAFTPGSVVFAGPSGVLAQDNANLFFDDTNNRLGIGTAAPVRSLTIVNAGQAVMRLAAGNSTTSHLEINDVATAGATINKTAATGALNIDISAIATDGVSSAAIRINRATNTTGASGLFVLKGDNTTTTTAFLSGGTGDSYTNLQGGGFGIGVGVEPGAKLQLGGAVTGAATAYGTYSAPVFQSDVATAGVAYASAPALQATAFTMADLRHFFAIGAVPTGGALITSQSGFQAASGLTAAAFNYAFRSGNAAPITAGKTHYSFFTDSNIATGGGTTWGFYSAGTANNYMAGALGIGTTGLTQFALRINKAVTGNAISWAVRVDGAVQSDVTSNAFGYESSLGTQAAAFTLADLRHFYANQNTFGAGSTVATQAGFSTNGLQLATTNYSFMAGNTSSITAGKTNYAYWTNQNIATGGGTTWGFYGVGTAWNHMNGPLGLGSTGLTQIALRVSLPITGAVGSYGVRVDSTIQPDVTSQAFVFYSGPSTAAAAFTVAEIRHYTAVQGTIGAGSAVTTQFGYLVDANMIGAATNYGFYGGILAGAGRWNFFANGTANNAFAGNTRIGSTSVPAVALDVTGAIAASTTVKTGVYTVATLPSAAASGMGARAFVTDANAIGFGGAVVAGGIITVTVYSNSASWLQG